jgi:spermidine synthase
MKNEAKGIYLIYLLFFFSGISGLIYETIWLRVLGRILGNTVYATSIVLAVFMSGMALGSYLIGKFSDKYKNPIYLYAILEAGVAISALVLYYSFDKLIPLYRLIYSFTGEEHLILTLFQAGLLFIILLIPTSLMGGTLPLLSSYTKRYKEAFTTRIGNLYGLNTLGAVAGVAASGLFTIGAWGELNTVITGVIINLFISLTAFYIAKVSDVESLSSADKVEAISPYSDFIRKIVLIAYTLNGFTAIACEVVYTRILQIHLGTSIYAFSMMLSLYLLGIALGSFVATKFVDKLKNPLGFFGLAQAFISLYSILGLYFFVVFTPMHNIALSNLLIVPTLIVFPITFILGLIFPAVSRSYVKNEENVGSGIGRLYCMNTLGAIFGSLICGFILMRIFGSRGTILFLASLNIIIGLIISFFSSGRYKNYFSAVSICALFCLFAGIFSPDPFFTVVKKRIALKWGERLSDIKIFYHRESLVATTTALGSMTNPVERSLWINGVGMTVLCTETKLMAHIPMILHGNPQNILVICMGMGTTLRSALKHKNVECNVVELDPEVYECYKYFHKDGERILSDPRVHHYVDDGRNFLLMHDKAYDIITMDPAPPLWSSGTVNLYTKEFFELCRARLKEEGIMCLWVMPEAFTDVRMIMATFQGVFPNTTVWRGPSYQGFYLIGSIKPVDIDFNHFRKAYEDKDIVLDLTEWDNLLPTPEAMLHLYLLNSAELDEFVKGSLIIQDNNPYTEFPLWRHRSDPYSKYILDGELLYKWKQKIFEF